MKSLLIINKHQMSVYGSWAMELLLCLRLLPCQVSITLPVGTHGHRGMNPTPVPTLTVHLPNLTPSQPACPPTPTSSPTP